MKKLLFSILLFPLVAFSQVGSFTSPSYGPSYSGVGATVNNFIPATGGSNVLTIDVNGSDVAGAANPYHALWKSAYDITAATSNSWDESFAMGALKSAKSGDWIVFNPGIYFIPTIPLNRYGNGSSNGVNLYIPEGVTIIRSNLQQTNILNTGLDANEGNLGPLIIPGNNSVIIINGTIITTNKSDGYDSAIGFNANAIGIIGFSPHKYYGFTNWIPTAFWAFGNGFLNPPWARNGTTNLDNIYMLTGADTGSLNNTNICNAYIGGLNMWAAWDNFAVTYNSVGGVNMVTDHVKTLSLNNLASVGFSASSPGTWYDYGSVFSSTTLGGVNANGIFANQPVNIFLNNTTFRLLNGAGVLFNLSGGATVSGIYNVYQETGNTNTGSYSSGTNYSIGGIASFATNSLAQKITATGVTNNMGVNACAYVTCTAVTFTNFDSYGNMVLTNTSATYNDSLFILQPGASIKSASGLSGRLLPF